MCAAGSASQHRTRVRVSAPLSLAHDTNGHARLRRMPRRQTPAPRPFRPAARGTLATAWCVSAARGGVSPPRAGLRPALRPTPRGVGPRQTRAGGHAARKPRRGARRALCLGSERGRPRGDRLGGHPHPIARVAAPRPHGNTDFVRVCVLIFLASRARARPGPPARIGPRCPRERRGRRPADTRHATRRWPSRAGGGGRRRARGQGARARARARALAPGSFRPGKKKLGRGARVANLKAVGARARPPMARPPAAADAARSRRGGGGDGGARDAPGRPTPPCRSR